MSRHTIELYVLGMMYFDDDTRETVLLDKSTLGVLGSLFTAHFKNKPEVGQTADAAYFKVRMSKAESPASFREWIGPDLFEIAREIQFGYYHHRAILKTSFEQNTSLAEIRSYRSTIHRIVREKCFDHFTDYQVNLPNQPTPLTIRYIYSYTLIIIPNGYGDNQGEQTALEKEGYDDVFSTRSTAFGFTLTESKRLGLIWPKSHYVRISVPGTIIYLSGNTIDSELKYKVIDGIYYGGLYNKIKIDARTALENGKFVPLNQWPQDLMIDTYRVLNETVSIHELSYISVAVERFSLALGIIALIISLIALLR
ncbi:MAG: hypothetical protein WCI67_07415 [Chloroflexales bacterium]